MRTPLIVLVLAYAISVLGFVLIPGLDDRGQPWKMDFFHAFYFVSFMGSTIGFGEIPYPFTGGQRLWTLFTIYATVIAWLYAIGTLIALMQSPLFRSAFARSTFESQVRKIRRPYYVICGYGDTGHLVVDALIHMDVDCVVIDKDVDRINELDLSDLPREVPRLHADASDTESLSRAGIGRKLCKGVVAVTHNDDVNLKVSIASKLLNRDTIVYCWAENHDTGNNMASFGTDHIINPYDTFAAYLSTALTSPDRYLLYQLLSSPHDTPQIKRIDPPKGRWLLCGYGRFGKAVYKKLLEHGLPVTVIEFDLDTTGAPEGSIAGRGTEAETLLAAQVNKAVGIIAGTDNDVNNLSILITARVLNPGIFTIARQQLSSNSGMFSAASLDLVTSSSSLVASQLLARITTPMTTDFLSMASNQDEVWTRDLLKRIEHCTDSAIPEKWVVAPGYENAPAFLERWNKGETVYLHHLLREPTDRKQKLRCIALLLQRDGKEILLPGDKTVVELHDRILLAGSVDAVSKIGHILTSREILHYTMTGQHLPASLFLGWLMRKKTPTASSSGEP